MPIDQTNKSVRVWDPVVRYGHWALAAGFTLAFLTADDDKVSRTHILAGYGVAAIVAFRILWGFFGTAHARFSDFAYGPGAAIAYLKSLVRGNAKRFIGHSPAGALMVFALLFCLGGTVITGIAMHHRGGEATVQEAGLLAPQAYAEANEGGADAEGGGEANEGNEGSALGEWHELFANITLALVLAHIAGVAFSSWSHRENLVAAMLSGNKQAEIK